MRHRGSHIEFGAQQCILVRNDAARDKLREQVGDIGLIMYVRVRCSLVLRLKLSFTQDSLREQGLGVQRREDRSPCRP